MDDQNKTKEELLDELAALRQTVASLQADEAGHKRVEDVIGRFAEANYSAIFDAANDAIFIQDIETGQIIDVNQTACKMYCYPKEELLNLSMYSLSADQPPCTAEEAGRLIKKAAEGEPQLFEWIAKDKAGRWFWVEVNLKRAVIGGKYRLLAVVRDIAGRKQTEERLTKINEVFLNFSADPHDNINRLTALCGELFGADCALYSRLEDHMLNSCGQWNVPPGFKVIDKPEGHICYDLIRQGSDEVAVIRNLQETEYAKTDPNVSSYGLQTYIGRVVSFGGNRVGTLCVIYKYDFVPTEEDKKIMGIIASAIGVEEERWSADDAVLRRTQALEMLSRTSQHLNAILETPTIMRTLVAAAMELIGGTAGMAGLLIDGKMVFNEYHMEGNVRQVRYSFEQGQGVPGWITNTMKPYICNDCEHDPQIVQEIRKELGFYNLAGVPILNRKAELLGCFMIYNKENHAPFDVQDVFMLQGLAASVSVALENAKMFNEIERSADELRQERDRAKGYFDVAGVMMLLIGADQKVTLINKKGCEVLGYGQEEIIGKNWFDNFIPKRIKTRVKNAFVKLMEGKVAKIEYFENPVMTKDRKERLIAWHNNVFRDAHGKIIAALSSGEDITERTRAEAERERLHEEIIRSHKKLQQLALKDPQTGLYNYRYLNEFIEPELYRATRYAHPLSVLMIDIDYFKSVNEVYGHMFGDMVLKQFADYLKKMVRRYDIVVRLGGAEFVVICPGADKFKAVVVAQRILDAVGLHNFGNKKHIVKLKLSIAAASFPEDKITKGLDLLNLADKILSRVKDEGGNKVYSSSDLAPKGRGDLALKKARVEHVDVKALKQRIEKLTKKGKQNLIESIFAFAKTIELKDHYTGEHVEDTVRYATEIARAMRLSLQEIDNIRQASVLHDLGKIGISDKILLKKTRLTAKEFEEIKRHPQIAADIIRPIRFMHDIIPLILYHHERWNGKGYPTGLSAEEIPIGARIIAVADVYQALTSNRPYRSAYSKKQAIEILKKGAGAQFDPMVVSIFLKILAKEKGKG